MSDQITPQSSFALVIGIERYAEGDSWKLNGPASDAVRFMEFLVGRGVPAANVQAFLSVLPKNQPQLLERARQCTSNSIDEPAKPNIEKYVTQTLPKVQAGVWFFFWAGHGIITIEDQRRLYTADATNAVKSNFDLNDFMAALRTHIYPGLNRQALIVDTCANYLHNPAVSLPESTLPKGDGMPGREQVALLAAAPSEYAKNLGDAKAGLFSRELMALLNAEAPGAVWPPNWDAIIQKLAERFTELRRAGQAEQTPTRLYFRDSSGSVQNLSQIQVPTAGSDGSLPRPLTISERTALLNAMVLVPTFSNATARERVIESLRAEIATNIPHGNTPRLEVMALLDTCRRYRGLLELLQAVNIYEANSPQMLVLVKTAHQILPDEVPETVD